MYRDIDPRVRRSASGRPCRGGRAGPDDARAVARPRTSRDVFSRDLDLPQGPSPRARSCRRP